MKKFTICVDFDGVVHLYKSPWAGIDVVSDPPVPGALKWLYDASKTFNVTIYSSRSSSPEGRAAMYQWMVTHSIEEFGADHPMSHMGAMDPAALPPGAYPVKFACEKPSAFLTIDDRAICFDGDWSKLVPSELLKFKPWNK